jgi:hypothetical protein
MRDKNIYYSHSQVDMVNNDTRPAGQLDDFATDNVHDPQLGRGMSKFAAVEGTRTHDKIPAKSVGITHVFTAAEWDAKKREIGATGGVFVDNDFPASQASLMGNHQPEDTEQSRQLKEFLNGVTWKRASEIDPHIELVQDGIRPNDIVQGALYDSYLLSSVASISEYQSRIRRLLVQDSTNKEGAYAVAINKRGNWQMVVVDDQLPLTKDKDGKSLLLGANSLSSELWVCILEKAYAKAYKSYMAIGNGGNVGNTMTDLTGAPSEIFFTEEFEGDTGGMQGAYGQNVGGMNMSGGLNHLDKSGGNNMFGVSQGLSQGMSQSNGTGVSGSMGMSGGMNQAHQLTGFDKLWNLLKDADINKYIMVAATKSPEKLKSIYTQEYDKWASKNARKPIEDFAVETFGLYPAFCYTILDIAEYNGEKLVRLRNTKGTTEWNGAWSDHDKRWDDIQEEFRAEKKNEGIFYMPFTDFQNMFEFITINYYVDSNHHTAFGDRLQSNMLNVYEMTVIVPGDYYIMLSQDDKRDTQADSKPFSNASLPQHGLRRHRPSRRESRLPRRRPEHHQRQLDQGPSRARQLHHFRKLIPNLAVQRLPNHWRVQHRSVGLRPRLGQLHQDLPERHFEEHRDRAFQGVGPEGHELGREVGAPFRRPLGSSAQSGHILRAELFGRVRVQGVPEPVCQPSHGAVQRYHQQRKNL